jgi:hypothetical protein
MRQRRSTMAAKKITPKAAKTEKTETPRAKSSAGVEKKSLKVVAKRTGKH